VGDGLVGGLVVGVHAQLAERLAVIARHQDGRLAEDAQIVELRAQGTHRLVGEADADVVAIEHSLHITVGPELDGGPVAATAPTPLERTPRAPGRNADRAAPSCASGPPQCARLAADPPRTGCRIRTGSCTAYAGPTAARAGTTSRLAPSGRARPGRSAAPRPPAPGRCRRPGCTTQGIRTATRGRYGAARSWRWSRCGSPQRVTPRRRTRRRWVR
jgi:hypothetical protein